MSKVRGVPAGTRTISRGGFLRPRIVGESSSVRVKAATSGLPDRCPHVRSARSRSEVLCDEAKRGTLDLLILRVVALGPIHGYPIAQRIQQVSKGVLQVQQGSLYPALHRLDAKFYRLAAK